MNSERKHIEGKIRDENKRNTQCVNVNMHIEF